MNHDSNLQFEAITKQLEIGGKLFCWHDYIYIREYLALYNCKHVYLCLKCGKEKMTEHLILEPLNHYK